MHQRLLTGQELDAGAVEALIAMSNEPTLEGIITGDARGPPIMIRTRRKTIVPRIGDADRLHARSSPAAT